MRKSIGGTAAPMDFLIQVFLFYFLSICRIASESTACPGITGRVCQRIIQIVANADRCSAENLETHIFENADVDWLHCIAAHRKKKMFIEVEREMAKYDIIEERNYHRTCMVFRCI